MKFILGKKLGMSQIFDENKKVIPVTLVEAGPCFVTDIKKTEKDNYSAVQVGFNEAKKLNKAQAGHLKGLKSLKVLKEFRLSSDQNSELKRGDEIRVDIFSLGQKVRVSAISKGKGFAGVVKRHGFAGGPASHGQKHTLRAPGSIGCAFPERVLKGKKMAGRMGSDRVTVKNLKIAKIDQENNILAIKGAVPGSPGTIVEIISLENDKD